MSRKSQTIATFAVRITVPLGYSIASAETFIKQALEHAGGKSPEDSFNFIGLEADVKLIQKVTIYGHQ